MGFFPCSKHGDMFRGAAQAAYPAIVEGQESQRSHLRLCDGCFADYISAAEASLNEVGNGNPPPNGEWLCCVCGDQDAQLRVFITTYPRKSEPRQFFGGLCRAHKDVAANTWLVSA